MKALWTPSESFIKKTNIFNFQKFLEKDIKKNLLTMKNFGNGLLTIKKYFG